MIRLERVTKRYKTRGVTTIVADDISATFPSRRSVGLLGRNGAGKSSLLRMVAGTMLPTSGRIWSDGTISWPVGFAGSFHGELTGAQNVRFVARIYGVDTDELVDYVRDFAKLGHHFDRPFHTYSSGMRSRLAFGTSMGIAFDTYLVDEVTSVGDGDFRRRSEEVFLDRMSGCGAIVVTHSMAMVRRLCNMGAVLHQARLHLFEDVDEAIAMHEDILGVPRSKKVMPAGGGAPPAPPKPAPAGQAALPQPGPPKPGPAKSAPPKPGPAKSAPPKPGQPKPGQPAPGLSQKAGG